MIDRMQLEYPALRQPAVILSAGLIGAGLIFSAGMNLWGKASPEETINETGAKSVAWYVANIHQAKAVNRSCFVDNNSPASADCQNALQALTISHVSQNVQN